MIYKTFAKHFGIWLDNDWPIYDIWCYWRKFSIHIRYEHLKVRIGPHELIIKDIRKLRYTKFKVDDNSVDYFIGGFKSKTFYDWG